MEEADLVAKHHREEQEKQRKRAMEDLGTREAQKLERGTLTSKWEKELKPIKEMEQALQLDLVSVTLFYSSAVFFYPMYFFIQIRSHGNWRSAGLWQPSILRRAAAPAFEGKNLV